LSGLLAQVLDKGEADRAEAGKGGALPKEPLEVKEALEVKKPVEAVC